MSFSKLFAGALVLLAACAAPTPETSSAASGAISGKRDAGSVTLHFYPRQETPINYGSPASTLLSFAKDQRVGHTMVDIKCERTSGETFELLTGQTGSENDEQYIDAGWGFKILDLSFPGYLQTADAVKGRLEQLSKSGKSSFLRVKVNADQCERMAKFYEGYTKNGDDKKFGLQLRPRRHEGGGCTSFGVTFLEVAGVVTDDHRDKWRQTLDVPDSLIGDPDNGKKVSKTDVITRFSWARSGETSTKAVFWEPNLIHQWVVDTREKASGKWSKVDDGIVPGIELDARDDEAPTDAIFEVDAAETEPATPPPGEKLPDDDDTVYGPDMTE